MHRAIAERDVAETAVTEAGAIDLYREMVRARTFDDRALALQRRGWMSGYPPFRGQEATQVGVAHAMAATDWLVPTYRSNAAQIARGVPMSDLFAFRKGYAEFQSGHDLPVFPQAVPIATQLPHAAGLGMAARHRGDETAILTLFGDGATSEGDFHEAMNFAGVFDGPVVFCCENNGWAISLPRERQTASETIAGKASAYGFEGKRVDGMDPIAVAECVADALATARESGPVLIESLTYRLGAHTTSDDPSRYREDDLDLPEWRTADPIERYETYLREQGLLDDETIAEIREDADAGIAAAVEHVDAMADPDSSEVFDHVYDRLPAELRRQRSTVDSAGEQN
ncbi:thiamine pyrophosphate-dependent enzyme [Natranaeroarchaeum sulfidigenes]|uniref:Pyruvate/2-oxoglutarate/acetoin dehydrogenase complex, dehydrogenase (E1) component, eukaryotic type, alpha subunit n=1 Tax=Natranaeroarchaeum sulfidigenes TaxID=2784880 RepID=A0A897MRL4_9EURY|nr:thiamine pyrophosphate-dependent enzyme [Natranaeroarchaeum sulfidigenes]QSG01663.1 Pyruvate/2-oxoglutarate/acetoin dehydrogenase complex, dehydrogenase (E1) component, eukaryotic type, alpha subunit [Natranaeroarchaeum sulfidigenes]